MKKFEDLVFKPHPNAKYAYSLPYPLSKQYGNAKQAIFNFANEYGVSVILGECYYSNGIDTYEVAILKDGQITYDTPVTNNVIGYLKSSEVSEIMSQVQELTD